MWTRFLLTAALAVSLAAADGGIRIETAGGGGVPDADQAANAQKLEKGLSPAFHGRLKRKGRQFIPDLGPIVAGIGRELAKPGAKRLDLTLTPFEDGETVVIAITGFATERGRHILRGTLEGRANSTAMLIQYRNALTGFLHSGDLEKVILLRATEDGVHAAFEVDASGFTYD